MKLLGCLQKITLIKLLSMELEEFIKHKATWLKEWHWKHRLMDVDFESYMLMRGLSREEFWMLNNQSNEKAS